MVTVVAMIKYLTPDEGGRLTPARSGYCPSIRFGDTYVMAAIEVEGMGIIALGEELRARIHFPDAESINQLLVQNQSFDIAEGARKVSEGTPIRRLDQKVEAAP